MFSIVNRTKCCRGSTKYSALVKFSVCRDNFESFPSLINIFNNILTKNSANLCLTDKMGSKKGSKGGTKKPVSKVKRANQKMNKLVKAGKAKPKSKPRYIPNQKKGTKGEKEAWLTPELREKWARGQEEDREAALEQLAETISGNDVEYLKNLHGNLKRKHDSDEEENEDDEDKEENDDELGEMERKAMNRIEFEKNNEKQVRGLLPIKTRDGVKQRIEEMEDTDGEGSGEDSGEEEDEDDDDLEDGADDLGHEVSSGQQYSVVELYAKRKEIIAEKKVTIGSLASNFLEAPEERIINLEKLVKMFGSEDQPKSVDLTVDRLVAASILELLKHVTPGYKIKPQDLNDGVKLKKETLKLARYEAALLKCYKNYLIKLEKLVNLIKGKQNLDKATSSQAIFFLNCMCQLLIQHPHFNFSKNILHALVPILSNSNEEARTLVKNAIEEVFKNDMRGEVSLEAVRLINHLVKSRKHNVRTEVVSVLLYLRIKNVDLDREKKEEIERKKMEARKRKLMEKSKISKQEKKRRKKLESLEKELLEARGEEGKKVKEKYFTETTKLVFTIYFRILKSYPKSQLMGAVLEGLSKFAHIINIEFFSDLLNVFQDLLEGETLSYRDTLLATGTVFKILSGQGETLNIDPTNFYSHLYSSLVSLSLTSASSSTPLALSSLQDMLIGRRKKVSKARVLGFTKRMCTVSLQLEHAGCMGALALLRQLLTTHTVTAHLLDSEHEVGNGIFDPSLGDPEHCNAANTTAWELSLLLDHYHPTSVRLTRHLLSGCPSQGEASLPQHLKIAPDQMYHQFSPDTGTFNPPVQPPSKKSKRGKTTPTTTSIDLDQLEISPDFNFFSGVIAKT